MRAHRAGLILAVLASGATACAVGGLSVQQWGERADAICADAQSDLGERERRGEPVDSGRVIARYRSALTELRGLEGPQDRAADIERLVAAIQDRVEVVEELQQRFPPSQPLTSRDDAALGELAARGDRAAAEADRYARSLGLGVCGRIG